MIERLLRDISFVLVTVVNCHKRVWIKITIVASACKDMTRNRRLKLIFFLFITLIFCNSSPLLFVGYEYDDGDDNDGDGGTWYNIKYLYRWNIMKRLNMTMKTSF